MSWSGVSLHHKTNRLVKGRKGAVRPLMGQKLKIHTSSRAFQDRDLKFSWSTLDELENLECRMCSVDLPFPTAFICKTIRVTWWLTCCGDLKLAQDIRFPRFRRLWAGANSDQRTSIRKARGEPAIVLDRVWVWGHLDVAVHARLAIFRSISWMASKSSARAMGSPRRTSIDIYSEEDDLAFWAFWREVVCACNRFSSHLSRGWRQMLLDFTTSRKGNVRWVWIFISWSYIAGWRTYALWWNFMLLAGKDGKRMMLRQ